VAHEDLPRPGLSGLDWSEAGRAQSLATLYREAYGYGKGAEEWYAGKRRAKRHAGRLLRVLAIVLTGVAALIPVLAEIYTTDGRPEIAPAWAAVALGVAATLVGLDRFFGFTSAWTRFMVAELNLTKLRHTFEYGWQETWVGAADPPSVEDTRRLIGVARDFVLQVDGVLAKETDAWIREFRSVLSRAEQDLAVGNRA
jgi:SMODS and SLOG-associating 2TM effector domain 2